MDAIKVTACKGCPHLRRRTWVQYYEPKNYHPIGFTHAYAYCEKHKKRVAQVQACEIQKKGGESR